MGFLLKLAAKVGAKAAKIDPTDVMNQQMGSDIAHMIMKVFL